MRFSLGVSILASLAGLATGSAFAASPKVNCRMDYSTRDAHGYTGDTASGPSADATQGHDAVLRLKGFTFTGAVTQVCAADGGPCGGYSLQGAIEHGQTATETSFDLPFSQQTLSLTVGRETAFVYCEVPLTDR